MHDRTPTDAEPRADERPTILVLTDHYLPGYRHGGPVRSIEGLVERLGSGFDLRILTRDRDVADDVPYRETIPNAWQPLGEASVRYLSPQQIGITMERVIRAVPHDVLYLNSYFSPRFSILPLVLRRARRIPRTPLVIAPRGEFSPGALRIRAPKKRAWIRVAQLSGLHDHALWQATTAEEAAQIRGVMGGTARVMVAPVLAPRRSTTAAPSTPKVPGSARLVFFSRIAPMKNLEAAVRLVQRADGRLTFDIYGPVDDEPYWDMCRRVIAGSQNPRVEIAWKGELEHERAGTVLATYDLALFPTHGESYGHAIHETLAAGCPVAVSDRTPWTDVDHAGAGWVLSLTDEEAWDRALAYIVAADGSAMTRLRSAARTLAASRAASDDDVERNRLLFEAAIRSRGSLEGRDR